MSTNEGIQRRLRIFVVDDHFAIPEGIARIVEDNPEHGLEFIGSTDGIPADLASRLQREGIDIVLIDIAFGRLGDRSGLAAIRSIRRALGANIGIVAYTVHHYRELALAAGADVFLNKGETKSRLAQALRACKDHETLSRVEVNMDQRSISLTVSRTGDGDRTQRLQLTGPQFVLLYYLTEERARNDINWLQRRPSEDESQNNYQFREGRLWSQICVRWAAKSAEAWDDWDISKHASLLNRLARETMHLSSDTNLIVVPGPGNKQDSSQSAYCLNTFIEPSKVTFEPEGERLAL